MKRIIAIFLTFTIFVGLILPVSAANDSESFELENVMKLYSNFYDAIKDAEFEGNGVIYVTMHHKISDVGRVYDASYFPELDIETIEDLTGVNPNDIKEDYGPEFRNVLKITLVDKTDQNVISDIQKLQERSDEDIYWAEPLYQVETNVFENGEENNSDLENTIDPNYWKNIIELEAAHQYLANNDIDLNNSDTR